MGNLLGVAPGKGLIVNEKNESWFFIANVSQYLFLTDDPSSVPEKLKTAFFYNEISSDLKRDVAQLTAGTSKVSDEKGIEVFYDLAITPAVRLIPSYQHIWNPFSAQVVTDQDHADIFLTRLTVAW